MIIHIDVTEFEEEFRKPWMAEFIKRVHIDYATNAIHGWFEDKDVIIFRFKDFGFINDNRSNIYAISSGSAGITIRIDKK